MLDRWSKRQAKVFEEYFKVSDGYTLEETREQLESTKKIWLELYQILASSGLQISGLSRIENIQLKRDNEQLYLIITIFSNRHIIIDCKSLRSLTEEDIIEKLDHKTIFELIGKHQDFTFETVSEDTAREFLDTYMINQDVYAKGPELSYKVGNRKDTSFFSMDLATQQIGLSFVGNHQEVNYLFFNHDKLDGMSGDCNRNIAITIGENVHNILIPKDVVNKYKVNEESLKLKYDYSE